MNPACGDSTHPATLACLGTILGGILKAALLFIFPVTIILIIVAGYKFVTSHGEAKQLEGARKTITFAIIGVVIVMFSFLILNIISTVTGVKCINTTNIFNASDIFGNCK